MRDPTTAPCRHLAAPAAALSRPHTSPQGDIEGLSRPRTQRDKHAKFTNHNRSTTPHYSPQERNSVRASTANSYADSIRSTGSRIVVAMRARPGKVSAMLRD